ncbi:MAG: Fe-S cluster assembly protein SufD [Actinobacteria bacterium]|uniref:Unannotated protein n=1 Tax=freshwater metagenome TaxID=449393 RepID=A0A6J7CVG4_9ZZZZ|nr:Fe-S cluster assembly protein SufD [Actinomycetota bacterium]MSW47897.1 Fe-S cluster assembly protein SufD [Actinomycetota bacterium]MSX24676.1 Fe-S cluster assembly protein SufD [Actinomycetota bacterium]MSY46535.1 Fe-S cluster assembly protein SufD [Actinomycetota bacterium]MSY57397.1 Fe-S cluster assembly protein SufD [Actinomycetota bacterium]
MPTLTSNYLALTGREEAWRFTPLNRLGGLHDGSARISTEQSLNSSDELPQGVSFAMVSQDALSPATQSDDVIVQRIHGNVTQIALLKIAANSQVAQPILLNRIHNQGFEAQYSQLRIEVGENAHATVIIENSGAVILGEDIEVFIAPGGNLKFVTLQEWSDGSVYAARHHANIGKDATFDSITVTVGGSLVRILPTIEFLAPGASAALSGVYFATAGQHFEHRIHVNHGVPKAKSRVNYKGALAGKEAHTVWIGDVFIRAAAEGTDTYELNRNLLLSDGARADSVPNLEIETGEIVGAGHASTTGRFDDEQLFYLMSRGIPMDEARRLVVRGFFAEVISQISNEQIEERLMARIDDELTKAGA